MSRKLIIILNLIVIYSVINGIGEKRTHNSIIHDARKAIESCSSVSNTKTFQSL